VQYIILRGKILPDIRAITLLLYSDFTWENSIDVKFVAHAGVQYGRIYYHVHFW